MRVPGFGRWRRLAGAVAMLTMALAGAGGLVAVQPADSDAATTYRAFVGGGRAAISIETFRPSVIFVNTGDSVEFVNPFEEIHTVTFLGDEEEAPPFIIPLPGSGGAGRPPTLVVNPKVGFPSPPQGPASYDGTSYVNSAILMKDQAFTVTFNQNGNFPFLCIIHPGMEGFVQVLPSGVTVPTQAQRDAEAQAQLDAAVAEGERLAAAAPRPAATTDAAGRTTHFVPTGPSVGTTDVMRFLQPRLQVNVGDTVTWTNDTAVPHTATFTVGQPAPALIMPQPQAGGPPNLVLNPRVLFPVGGSTFDGSSYANSGFIGAGPEATAGQSYSLTFTKAGTYPYICVLHADQGMAGVIEVGTGTGIRPPSTGDAGLTQGGAGLPLWPLVAAATAVTLLALLALRVRSVRT